MDQRVVVGILVSSGGGALRAQYASMLQRALGSSAVLEHYTTRTSQDLALRLSEMFLHDRRMYLLAPSLAPLAPQLLDTVDDDARRAGRADLVINIGGVLHGMFLGDITWEERLALAVHHYRAIDATCRPS